MNKELIDEIDKLIYHCYNKTFKRGMKFILDEYYSTEDFFQDVRLQVFKVISNSNDKTGKSLSLSPIVYNQMRWQYVELFGVTTRDKTEKPRGSLQESMRALSYVGSTLVPDEGENLSDSSLHALAGSYKQDLEQELMYEVVIGIITDIIPDDDIYKEDILFLLSEGRTSSKDIADKHGCSMANISKKVRRYKNLIVERLNNLGYNIDQDLVVYT